MSDKALETRVHRITNVDKLRSFIQVSNTHLRCCHLQLCCAPWHASWGARHHQSSATCFGIQIEYMLFAAGP